MKYFSIKELCVSSSYPHLVRIPVEGSTIYSNLKNLIENLLDPIRGELEKPIIVASGYRHPKLNKAIGGSKTSNHLYGYAADVHIKGNNIEIVEALLELGLQFDECIAEGASFNKEGELVSCQWVHLALKPSNNRKKFFYTSNFKNYFPLKYKNNKLSK